MIKQAYCNGFIKKCAELGVSPYPYIEKQARLFNIAEILDGLSSVFKKRKPNFKPLVPNIAQPEPPALALPAPPARKALPPPATPKLPPKTDHLMIPEKFSPGKDFKFEDTSDMLPEDLDAMVRKRLTDTGLLFDRTARRIGDNTPQERVSEILDSLDEIADYEAAYRKYFGMKMPDIGNQPWPYTWKNHSFNDINSYDEFMRRLDPWWSKFPMYAPDKPVFGKKPL